VDSILKSMFCTALLVVLQNECWQFPGGGYGRLFAVHFESESRPSGQNQPLKIEAMYWRSRISDSQAGQFWLGAQSTSLL
jgi:hypothetical protein